MVTQFQKTNRVKSLFSQIDNGRPQAAQQKLGAIMGSQTALANQTTAQTAENTKVNQAATNVATNTTKGYTGISEIGNGEKHIADQQKFAGMATPVLTTKAAPIAASSETRAADSANNTGTAINDNRKVTAQYENAGNALIDRANPADLATKQLAGAYQTDVDALNQAQTQMTEGNLGQLSGPSDYEIEQAQMAQVLADRQSNIGKLKSMYGVGYDTSKYGALDSNLLQGQFNDAQGQARTGIENLESARKGGDYSREQYLDQVGTSRTTTDKAKVETETKIADISKQIDLLNQKITASTGKAQQNLTETKARLELERDKLEPGLIKLDNGANAVREAYNQKRAQERVNGTIQPYGADDRKQIQAKRQQEANQDASDKAMRRGKYAATNGQTVKGIHF